MPVNFGSNQPQFPRAARVPRLGAKTGP
ncbi:hypothetical protein LCGC14_2349210, partial [marine sediment metagenome]